jgi:hypothetical protein
VLSLPAVRRSVVLAAAALALAGCGSSSSSSSSGASNSAATASSTSAASASAGASGCRRVAVPAPKGAQHLAAPTLRLDPSRTYTVTVDTNCGDFAFTLDVKDSPKTWS